MRIWRAICLVLLVPAACWAQEGPEALLPGTTQLYMRWDGVDAHALDYAKTALGKTLAGDTGKFINSVFEQLHESLSGSLTVDQLLRGVSPEKLKKLQADAKEIPGLLKLFSAHGFLLAGEARSIEPPKAELTLVVPDAADKAVALFATLRLIAALSEAEVKESKIGSRTVSHVDAGPVNIAWWLEGKHAFVAVGTEGAEALVQRRTAGGTETKLTGHPLYKKVKSFKGFPTAARGFIDVPGLAGGFKTGNKEVASLVADLGVEGIKSITFYSGFDGDADRSLIEIEIPGQRKGLLSLASGKPFKLSDVPPLPTDVSSWSMLNFNTLQGYDTTLQLVEGGIKLFKPEELAGFKEGVKRVDDALGVRLRDDILAHLDDKVLVYNSPAEGPVTLGQTFLFKVKNAEKLEDSLEQAVKNLLKFAGGDAMVKKRKFHEAEIHEVSVRTPGFFFVPSWTIYKGWLAIGYYPQAVKGYVLRASGELPAWKAPPQAQASFERLPREFTSIRYSDPTPSVKQLLSLAPTVVGLINSSTKDIKLDVGALPNAHEATRHLFPNIAVGTDAGGIIRIESRSSLELPVDLNGLEFYAFIIAFSRF